MRAEDRCPAIDSVSSNEAGTAAWTRRTLSTIGLKLFRESTALTSCVAIVAEACATRLDRFGENRDNSVVNCVDLAFRQRLSCARGVDSRAPQRLVGVDVSNPRDFSLIHQNLFYCLCRAPNNAR